MPDIVMGALVRRGMVLLARRSSKRKVHPNLWSLPGGHVEDGEDIETAMCRELMEEICVTPEHWQLIGRVVSEGSPAASTTFHVYNIDKWSDCPRLIGDEHTELRWFNTDAMGCECELALPELVEVLGDPILHRRT